LKDVQQRTLLTHAALQPAATFLQLWSPTRGELERCSFAELAEHMLNAANSVAYLAVSLGAMSLGAGSVNLNWRSPTATNRLLVDDLLPKCLVDDLLPKCLVTSATFAEAAAAVSASGKMRREHLETIWPLARLSGDVLEKLVTDIDKLDPSTTAAVFFTAGTTGKPKAVPHNHGGLLWFAERCLEIMQAGFQQKDETCNGTVCFTPFFHVMGFVANLVFNLHVGCRAFILDV
jgi:acyl-CoA synthetase (AMP-forming)/AMP-acid ligase II